MITEIQVYDGDGKELWSVQCSHCGNRKMLDKGGNDEIKDDMDRCKEHMSSLLQSDAVMTEELAQKIAPNCPRSHLVSDHTSGS